MLFGKRTLTWKFYIINEAIPTTKQVQIIDLKEFFIAALDADNKTFVMHMAIKKHEEMLMNFEK